MKPSSIALGFFDGVHIAHQKIILHAVDFARENNLTPIALTFVQSPAEILAKEEVLYITDNQKKEKIIADLGAKAEFLPLSEEFLNMEPEEFVKQILVKRYNIKHAVCGYNYRFGKGGSGDTKLLYTLGKKYGFTTNVCDKVTYNDENVSSSRIRKLICEGNIKLANKLMGQRFSLSGKVAEGKQLGHTLGFPTANIFFKDNAVIPLCGVYKTNAIINGESYSAITNIGINPTVGGERMRSETHILGFSGNLYGKPIEIEFIDFLRKETKFDSVDMLKRQIEKDIKEVKKG